MTSSPIILDQWGAPYKYAHASERSRRRGPVYPVDKRDIDQLITSWDAATIRGLSSRLYTNLGVVKTATKMLADYSVGDAFLPTYSGVSDFEDGTAIASYITKYWFPQCNVKGPSLDWHETLRVTSIEMTRGGDAIWLKVIGPDGMPRLQIIPPHRIGNGMSGEGLLQDGAYVGNRISDGVIVNGFGRPIAYRILTGRNMETPVDVPASSVIHDFEVEFSEQIRGLPSFTHAIEDLKTCLQSTEDERVRQMIVSRLHLTITNELGGPDLDDPENYMHGDPLTGEGFVMKQLSGGITYMQAGSGEKIEQLKQETPGDIWESFQDRMIRMSVNPVFPYGLVWKGAGQGTDTRADVVKARRMIQRRQQKLASMARRAVAWAYSVFRERGDVPELDHPFSWTFSRPPRFSVDDGRESKMEIDEWRAGLRNTGDITESQLGMTEEEFYERRAWSVAKRKIAARRVSEIASQESGFEIAVEDREMAMLTANEMPTSKPANQPTNPERENDDESNDD
jgi:hypothetical protein